MKSTLVFWLAVLFLVGGGGLLATAWHYGHSDSPPDQRAPRGVGIGEFQLVERSGRTFDSKDLKGQVWIASFFFASCTSTCRQQNEVVQSLSEEFGPQGVRFVSITCDPQNDTPERLRDYARDFRADPKQWLFLTGEMAYIRRIGTETFQLPVEERVHTERLILVDKRGSVRGTYSWKDAESLKLLKRRISDLLAEAAAPSPGEAAPAGAPTGAPASG